MWNMVGSQQWHGYTICMSFDFLLRLCDLTDLPPGFFYIGQKVLKVICIFSFKFGSVSLP